MEVVNQFVDQMVFLMTSYGFIFGTLLIILESILPVLPLSVFITLNVASYGDLLGILISWSATIIGCSLSFFLFRKIFSKKLYKFIKNKDMKKLDSIMKQISKINFSNLTILIAIPFSPAFLINIAAGLSKISYKKFLSSLVIGKLIMVYFWGYIGKSLLESLTDISVLIRIIVLLSMALLVSKFVEKRLNIK